MIIECDDLLEIKKNKIVSIIDETIASLGDINVTSGEIMESFSESGVFSMTAPQIEKSGGMKRIKVDSISNFKKGQSTKPGNIIINFVPLIKSLPNLIVDSIGAVRDDCFISKILLVLVIIQKIMDNFSIDIDKEHSIAVIALWQNCDLQHQITLEKGFECYNSLCRRNDLSECSYRQYVKIIDDLQEIKCLEHDDDTITILEKVIVKYDR